MGKRWLGVPIGGAVGFCLALRPLSVAMHPKAGTESWDWSEDLYNRILPSYAIPGVILGMIVASLSLSPWGNRILRAAVVMPRRFCRKSPVWNWRSGWWSHAFYWLCWGLVPVTVLTAPFFMLFYQLMPANGVGMHRDTLAVLRATFYMSPLAVQWVGMQMIPTRRYRHAMSKILWYLGAVVWSFMSVGVFGFAYDTAHSFVHGLGHVAALWLGVASAYGLVEMLGSRSRRQIPLLPIFNEEAAMRG